MYLSKKILLSCSSTIESEFRSIFNVVCLSSFYFFSILSVFSFYGEMPLESQQGNWSQDFPQFW